MGTALPYSGADIVDAAIGVLMSYFSVDLEKDAELRRRDRSAEWRSTFGQWLGEWI